MAGPLCLLCFFAFYLSLFDYFSGIGKKPKAKAKKTEPVANIKHIQIQMCILLLLLVHVA